MIMKDFVSENHIIYKDQKPCKARFEFLSLKSCDFYSFHYRYQFCIKYILYTIYFNLEH
jgi:hypothetical protein